MVSQNSLIPVLRQRLEPPASRHIASTQIYTYTSMAYIGGWGRTDVWQHLLLQALLCILDTLLRRDALGRAALADVVERHQSSLNVNCLLERRAHLRMSQA